MCIQYAATNYSWLLSARPQAPGPSVETVAAEGELLAGGCWTKRRFVAAWLSDVCNPTGLSAHSRRPAACFLQLNRASRSALLTDANVLPFLPAPFCPAELPGEEEAEEARRLYALVLQQLGELRRTTLQVAAQF